MIVVLRRCFLVSESNLQSGFVLLVENISAYGCSKLNFSGISASMLALLFCGVVIS